MAGVRPARRLIINADDFGRSRSINAAVIEAHRNGVLTTASLMVAGEAFEEAVQLARQHPALGVGLHLTLCCGRSVCPPSDVPSLVNAQGEFSSSPISAGLCYFFSPRARRDLVQEISAQFAKFRETGLRLDHVNGHLHLHLHPTVLQLLSAMMKDLDVRAFRLTRDPLMIDWAIGQGRVFYRLSHALVFSLLARHALRTLKGMRVVHTDYVFGLLENDRVTEDYILKLLPRLPPGDSELYSHPSLGQFRHEYNALLSPRVRDALKRENIQLTRYQELWPGS